MPTLNDAPEPPPRRPSRMEQEIAEILERTDEPVSFTDHVRRKAAAPRRAAPSPSSRQWSWQQMGPGSYLLGALGFAFLGALINGWSPLLAMLLGLISVTSMIMVWVRRTPPGLGESKMWRGRPLDSSPGTPQWLDDLRNRFQGPPDRR